MAKSRTKKGSNSQRKKQQHGIGTRSKAAKVKDFDVEDDLSDSASDAETPLQTSASVTLADHIDKVLQVSTPDRNTSEFDNPLNNGAVTYEALKELDTWAAIIKDKTTPTASQPVVGEVPIQPTSPVRNTPWKNLFDQGNVHDKGLGLNYVSPVIQEGVCVASVDMEEVEQLTNIWNRAVAFYVIGEAPTIDSVSRYVGAAWRDVPKPKIQRHSDGYFVLLFQSQNDCQKVLNGGPYTIGGKPILLKKWTSKFNLHDELRIAPLWVKLPGLPVIYWGAKTLSRIASVIGVPLMADDFTTRQARVSFARVLIEVDITKPLPSSIKFVNENGLVVEQKVSFEWVPPFCFNCQVVGHDCHKRSQRPTRLVQKWVVKQP